MKRLISTTRLSGFCKSSAQRAENSYEFSGLSLVEKDKMGLKVSVYHYLPYPVFKNVVIDQLISHTSGLEDAEYILEDHWKAEKHPGHDDAVEFYSSRDTLNFTPGSKYEYNNGAYDVLAKIIGMVSGLPFRDYMRKEIFEPIGMNTTHFIDMSNPQLIMQKALCYEKDGLGHWQAMEGEVVDDLLGAGGIYTNLKDYFEYVEALRNKKILNSDLHHLIFKPISMNMELHSEDMSILKGKESSYAMGWEVFDDMAVSAGLYYGVNNWAIFEFTRPLSIVILSNNDRLFREKLVYKTYEIVNNYFSNSCQ